MRHRSRPLQVSTFPFLAVLLCTMGSLILLLLVIDRQARAVARAKALRAAERAEAEDAEAAAARRAEFERRRLALHDFLRSQEQELGTAVGKIQREQTAKRRELEADAAHSRDSANRLRMELLQIRQEQLELEQHRTELKQHEQAASRELSDLTRDLLRLEQTLTGLKQARQYDDQRYSVVPYRGRLGEQRRPIYLECRSDSLVFHRGGPATPGRDAVARRNPLSGQTLISVRRRRFNCRDNPLPLVARASGWNRQLLQDQGCSRRIANRIRLRAGRCELGSRVSGRKRYERPALAGRRRLRGRTSGKDAVVNRTAPEWSRTSRDEPTADPGGR